MKIEKLYSDYDEYYYERLYSTGNDELDDLLERAFCDGYEYAQREFGALDKAIVTKSGNALLNLVQGNGRRAARISNQFNKRFNGTSIESMRKAGARAGMKNEEVATKIAEKLEASNPPTKNTLANMAKNLGPDRSHALRSYKNRRAVGLI